MDVVYPMITKVIFMCFISLWFPLSALATPQQTVTAEALNNGAYCQSILDSCPFAQAACVSSFCSGLQQHGRASSCDAQGRCCGKINAQGCLVGANLQNSCFNIQNSLSLCPTAPASLQIGCICAANTNFDTQASRCGDLIRQGKYSTLSNLVFGSPGALNYCSRNRQTTATITNIPSTIIFSLTFTPSSSRTTGALPGSISSRTTRTTTISAMSTFIAGSTSPGITILISATPQSTVAPIASGSERTAYRPASVQIASAVSLIVISACMLVF